MASVAASVPSLILVRHCQAAGQEPDAPLTPAGQRQALDLAQFLSAYPVDVIVTSAYLRARQTAQPLADRLHLSVEVDPRLNERTLSQAPSTTGVRWCAIPSMIPTCERQAANPRTMCWDGHGRRCSVI